MNTRLDNRVAKLEQAIPPFDPEAAIKALVRTFSDEKLSKLGELLQRSVDDSAAPLTDEELQWINATSGGLVSFP